MISAEGATIQLSRCLWIALAASLVGFHIGLIFSGLVPNLVSRPIHMALILPWIFLYRVRGMMYLTSGAILTALGSGSALWVAISHDRLGDQFGFIETYPQYLVASILLVSVLEAARRTIGWPLPLVASIALLYALFGHLVPGEFGHSGAPLASFLGTMTIAEGGLWGNLTAVSVGVVSILVIFGAVLNAGEAGMGFMNVAAFAAGRLRGGAAKVSVIASALFGSISGSASANVASTGAITLPAMNRLGYPKRLSAAVEAVASSGGQIMPPLMGAGAFVMVELTGLPYTSVMAAAFLPALLYFFAVWIGINAYARRFDLRGMEQHDRRTVYEVVTTSAFFMVPFSLLLVGMFYWGFTPQYSACMAIGAGTLLLCFDSDLKIDLQRLASRLESALITSARQVSMIASIILCASIIIGVLSVTGLGVKLTSLILAGSHGLIWPSLFLTAIACLILGMEVPTTAAYVICVSVAGPALIQLGLEPLQAHLFVFWFALLSTITPPVCGAVFVASGMVGENWLKVALTAMTLGIGLYIVPFSMIARPAIIELESAPVQAIASALITALGIGAFSFGLIGAQRVIAKISLLILGIVILFWPMIFALVDLGQLLEFESGIVNWMASAGN